MSEIIREIHRIARQVTDKEINQLRIEEELLIALAQNPKQSLAIKGEALRRVGRINQLQLELLGSSLKSKSPKLS